MTYNRILIIYGVLYSILGYFLLFFYSIHLPVQQWIGVFLITILFFTAISLNAPLTRSRTTIAFVFPFYVLGILLLKQYAAIPVFIASLWAQLRVRRVKSFMFYLLALVWTPVRVVPIFAIANFVYEKSGGGDFHQLADVRWFPFISMILLIAFLDGLSLNFASALIEGKSPWKLSIPVIQFIDLPFSPLAIPAYLVYQAAGTEGLVVLLLPVFGMIFVTRQLLLEGSKKQETMDLLNAANELIKATLDYREMIRKITERAGQLFKADGVEVFLNESGNWKLEQFIGKSPWDESKPSAEFLKKLETHSGDDPALFLDVRGESAFLQYAARGLFSIIFIPLLVGEKKTGMIVCSHGVPSYFMTGHIHFARVFMGQASSALLGAKLHGELAKTLDELKRTEAALIQSEKMAGLGKLVAGVAHEINNPLNFLSMEIPILEEKVTKQNELLQIYESYEKILPVEDQKLLLQAKEIMEAASMKKECEKILRAVKEGTSRATKIVANLRTFARAEAMEEGDYTWDYADLRESLEATLEILAPMHHDRIQIHKDYGETAKLWCCPQQLNQIFMNILSNAFEAIEGNGNVWLETKETNGKIFVAIRDSGKGIPREIQKKIFEPFFTTKEIGKGTGLGLSIVHGIVKRHKGEIAVESLEGKGTTVTLIFPSPVKW